MLAALLFAMSAEQRARQLGTLLALGLTRRQAGQLLLGEGSLVAMLGCAFGVLGAMFYAASVTNALTGVWSGAVAGSVVLLHMTPMSLIVGPLATLLISLFAMALSVRGLAKHNALELLGGSIGKISTKSRLPRSAWIMPVCFCARLSIACADQLTNRHEGGVDWLRGRQLVSGWLPVGLAGAADQG